MTELNRKPPAMSSGTPTNDPRVQGDSVEAAKAPSGIDERKPSGNPGPCKEVQGYGSLVANEFDFD